MFALPGQMFTVLEQTLAEFAAQQCVAVLIQTVGEVLARHANPCSPEGDESPLVYPGRTPGAEGHKKSGQMTAENPV